MGKVAEIWIFSLSSQPIDHEEAALQGGQKIKCSGTLRLSLHRALGGVKTAGRHGAARSGESQVSAVFVFSRDESN